MADYPLPDTWQNWLYNRLSPSVNKTNEAIKYYGGPHLNQALSNATGLLEYSDAGDAKALLDQGGILSEVIREGDSMGILGEIGPTAAVVAGSLIPGVSAKLGRKVKPKARSKIFDYEIETQPSGTKALHLNVTPKQAKALQELGQDFNIDFNSGNPVQMMGKERGRYRVRVFGNKAREFSQYVDEYLSEPPSVRSGESPSGMRKVMDYVNKFAYDELEP
jgi:hypothetical protein